MKGSNIQKQLKRKSEMLSEEKNPTDGKEGDQNVRIAKSKYIRAVKDASGVIVFLFLGRVMDDGQERK